MQKHRHKLNGLLTNQIQTDKNRLYIMINYGQLKNLFVLAFELTKLNTLINVDKYYY